jgi:hypothetical protein
MLKVTLVYSPELAAKYESTIEDYYTKSYAVM